MVAVLERATATAGPAGSQPGSSFRHSSPAATSTANVVLPTPPGPLTRTPWGMPPRSMASAAATGAPAGRAEAAGRDQPIRRWARSCGASSDASRFGLGAPSRTGTSVVGASVTWASVAGPPPPRWRSSWCAGWSSASPSCRGCSGRVGPAFGASAVASASAVAVGVRLRLPWRLAGTLPSRRPSPRSPSRQRCGGPRVRRTGVTASIASPSSGLRIGRRRGRLHGLRGRRRAPARRLSVSPSAPAASPRSRAEPRSRARRPIREARARAGRKD